MMYNIQPIYRITRVMIMLLLFITHIVFAQNTKINDDPEARYAATLEYGIEVSVIDVIDTLQELKVRGYEEEVLNRMQSSNNSDLIVGGITYLRELEYKSTDALEFCLDMLVDYNDLPRRSIQFAIFYIGDNVDLLTEDNINFLKNTTLDIIDTENSGISLAILELLPKYYSEENIPYLTKDEDKDKEEGDDNTVVTETEVEKKDDMTDDVEGIFVANGSGNSSNNDENERDDMQRHTFEGLLSTKLKNKYDEINTVIIQSQILQVMGQIIAYNQVEFLLETAEDEQENTTLQTQAINALAYFENLSEEEKEKLDILFDEQRHNKTADVRNIIIRALEVIALRTNNEKYIQWIREGLRDNEMRVRQQSLKSLYVLFEDGKGSTIQDDVFNAVKYMISYDTESKVKGDAVRTLSTMDGGSEYLVEKIKKIKYINAETKALIDIGVGDLADQGGVEALQEIVKQNIDKRNNSIIEYIAGAMSKNESNNFGGLVGILLQYKNPSVLLACLTTIGRNNITTFNNQIETLSKDITQSTNVRNRAKQILKISQEEENE